ncbi:hypothetical protein BJ166DRAFT_497042 [Pestalotiopsis sp. NC0098]|nr:hypothetical protein BJ166DRAFT_497042 [Pestalotiopsis sp. NC0098]
MPSPMLVDLAHTAVHTKMDLLPTELLRQIFILIADDGSNSLLAICKVNRRLHRFPPTISRLDKASIVKELSRHVERPDPVLVQSIRLGIPDALCVFLILLAVNLEHLDVAIPSDGGTLEIIQCLAKTAETGTLTSWTFQRLQRVSLKGDSTTRYADGQQIAPVLRLPHLVTLRLARLSLEHLHQAPEGRGVGEHFPRGTSPLERLIITKCRVTSLGLTVLTSACKSLKYLDLTWYRGLGKLLQPGRELLSALPPSLESIKLGDNNPDFKTDQWLAFHEYIMEDAVPFTCLKEINMWDIPINPAAAGAFSDGILPEVWK